MEICNREKCLGCGACAASCFRGAISFSSDARGFLYPVIDNDLCVECGVCKRKCPANQSAFTEGAAPVVLAAWTRNRKKRIRSSSGGVFPILAEEILSRGGAVFGARWTSDFGVEHCAITSKDDVVQLAGSKYAQSNTVCVYAEVERYLREGKPVLFSGTPCQVDALRQYLGSDTPLLYTVDVICHGVPSAEVLRRHLDEITMHGKKRISRINLRFKKPCWSNSSVLVKMVKGRDYYVPTVADSYYNLFNFNYTLRDCCHTCRYTTTKRGSDITLADFWGYAPKNFKMRDYERGVSCILINTERGQELIDKVKENLVWEERSLEDALRANRSLRFPFPPPKDKDSFWADYEAGLSIKELNDKYIKEPYHAPRYLWLRKIVRRYKWLLKK